MVKGECMADLSFTDVINDSFSGSGSSNTSNLQSELHTYKVLTDSILWVTSSTLSPDLISLVAQNLIGVVVEIQTILPGNQGNSSTSFDMTSSTLPFFVVLLSGTLNIIVNISFRGTATLSNSGTSFGFIILPKG